VIASRKAFTIIFNTYIRNMVERHTKKSNSNYGNCAAPSVNYRTPKRNQATKSCYPKSYLRRLVHAFNNTEWAKDNPIVIDDAAREEDIWKEIYSRMKHICNNEKCWLNHLQVTEDGEDVTTDARQFFLPMRPESWKSNPRTWLTNFDIERIMKMYTKKHRDFHFIGPVPIDFAERRGDSCISKELCDITIAAWKKKKYEKVGIVFNTDPSYLGGSHWIATYIDLQVRRVYFYDSYGIPPPHQVRSLLNGLAKELGTELKYNPRRHQYFNTECGVYCIHFILSLIEGKIDFESYVHEIALHDDEVVKYRDIFWDST